MENQSQNIIEINHLTKRFKEETVLDDVSISFQRGLIHGIIGRNGSGKTMMFKCICGFIPPTDGEILVDGRQIGKDIDVPDNVGIIIESPGFLPNYDGFHNLKFLADIRGTITDDDIRAAIKLAGLDPLSKKHVGKYSLGMRQRLGIAQAIMENPDLLILDEPFNALDISGVEEMRQLLLKLKGQGKTILIASHSKEDVDFLCDTVIRMDKGRIIERSNQ
ncbi:MAG: ATP-binding cassette domain-containing protein [Clostridia bacterium]|nr:ATP-binding cassette domain-containing protein [Clostridia bacterium]